MSDLLPSVNDADQSQRLVTQLMELATSGNCNIVVVIHLNRSGDKRNLRGWLGTEILHKSFEVFYCEQVPQSELYSVEQLFTRKFRISTKLYYRINDEGLPEKASRPNALAGNEDDGYDSRKSNVYAIHSNKVDSFNQKYIIRNANSQSKSWEWNYNLLFADAMDGHTTMYRDTLKETAMKLSGILQPKYYEKVFNEALEKQVIMTTLDRKGRIVVYTTPT